MGLRIKVAHPPLGPHARLRLAIPLIAAKKSPLIHTVFTQLWIRAISCSNHGFVGPDLLVVFHGRFYSWEAVVPHDNHPLRVLFAAAAAFVLTIAASEAEAEDRMIRHGLSCEAADGLRPEPLDKLCRAVASELADDAHLFRLVLLSASDNGMRARLDRLGEETARPGPEVDFSVMDRNLASRDYEKFAASLVRISRKND